VSVMTARRSSASIGYASHRDQCQSLHTVVRIIPYHKTVGLSRDQPAASEFQLTARRSDAAHDGVGSHGGTGLVALSRALCLEPGGADAPRVNPWLTSGRSGQR